jgi:Fe-S cluster biogenesis protein NfuA
MSAPTREQVEAALESARAELISHGGNVELIAVNAAGVVLVRLIGACSGCKSAGATLHNVIEKALKERLPGVTGVQAVM